MDRRTTLTDTDDSKPRSTAVGGSVDPESRSLDAGRDEADRLVGARLDRYLVEARRGAGGMGVVYAAYDPALDRRVALKVLPVIEEHRREHLERRLRREAQALARLAHPNVVAVYDVGVAEHSVFVAMQLVDGVSADVWLESARRTPRAIVEMLGAAGQGLAAAHAAGIIHRDVKPSNVLIDASGRVCVGDFGLARSADETDPTTPDDRSLLDEQLTRAGAVLGTPPFMAPEQHRGEPATARSDQFSFCVMAWRALFGSHPFVPGRWDTAEARDAMSRNAVREMPRPRGVPVHLVRALRRGLRHDPDERWPSMEPLMHAIAPRSHAAWWWGGGVLVVGMTIAAVVTSRLTPAAGPPLCDDPAPVWGPLEQVHVRKAFMASGRPYAADTFDRVSRALAGRDAMWSAAHRDACAATEVRGEQTHDLFDRRMLCLNRRNDETRALVEQLSSAVDGALVDRAVPAISKLGSIADCANIETLLSRTARPQDPVGRARIADLERRLDRASALDHLGKYQQGIELVQPIVDEARAIPFAPASAEALYLIGRFQDGLGKYPEAESVTYEAIAEAGRAGDDVLEARALLLEIFITNDEEGHSDIASALARAAAGVVARVNQPDITASLLYYRGGILYTQGKLPEAQVLLERAQRIWQERSDKLAVARALNTLSLVHNDLGHADQALASVQQALANYRDELGVDHPDTVTILTNLAMIETRKGDDAHAREHYHQGIATIENVFGREHGELVPLLSDLSSLEADEGHLELALELVERAQQIVERSFGPDNPRMAWTLDNLGEDLRRIGRLEEAEATQRRALALAQKLFGAEHPDVAYGLDGLGKVLRDRDKLAEARTTIEAGLALREKALGADNEAVAWSLESRASVLAAQGDCTRATADANRARAILEKKFGPEHRDLIAALSTLGQCATRDDAVPLFERALAIAVKTHTDPVIAADVQLALAKALDARGADRERSVELARAARAAYAGRAAARKMQLREVTAWLARRAG